MSSTDLVQPRRRLAALFAVPFAFSIAFFLVTTLSDRVDLNLQRIQNLESCVNRLHAIGNDVETGQHGYLLTGNRAYLISLDEAITQLPGQVRGCEMASDDQEPELRAGVREFGNLIKQQSSQASDVLKRYREAGAAAALDVVNQEQSVQLAMHTRRAVESLELRLHDAEMKLLDRQQRWNRRGYVFFVLGTLAMVLVMMRLYHAAVTYLHGRDGLQKQLHELNMALESEVEERTRDLKAANEELQQFAYVASHDLQEPLRTVTSFSQLLESRYRGRLDDDADEFIGYIVTASRRMTELINGLLALARLRKTGQPTVPVDLTTVVEEVKSNLAASIRESNASITCGQMPSLVVDRVQITQLLQNLISNAIKYRKPDVAPEIAVASRRDDSRWILSVQDNGCGFDVAFAERIFGLFQRLPDRTRAEGTGIGLSIAKKIVERHGGRIWADSKVGEGSTFFVSLPVSLETARIAGQPEMMTRAQAVSKS